MKYKRLKQFLDGLSPQQLEQTVVVFITEFDEYNEVSSAQVTGPHIDELEPNHPILVIDKEGM